MIIVYKYLKGYHEQKSIGTVSKTKSNVQTLNVRWYSFSSFYFMKTDYKEKEEYDMSAHYTDDADVRNYLINY